MSAVLPPDALGLEPSPSGGGQGGGAPAAVPGTAPASAPTVPHRITSDQCSWPRAAWKPAKGMMSSEGKGGNRFSASIRAKIAQ